MTLTDQQRADLDRIRPYRNYLLDQGMRSSEALTKAICIAGMDDRPDDPAEAVALYDQSSEQALKDRLDAMLFRVWDKEKERFCDHGEALCNLADEEWASRLMKHDMEGFFISQQGDLLLTDECGESAMADQDRFEVRLKR